MLKNFLENIEFVGYHPTLDKYITNNDLTVYKSNAEKWLISRMKNDNVKLRQLMIPLNLSLINTVEESDIERLRFVINLSTAPAAITTFTLTGSDDNITFNTVATLVFLPTQSGLRSITFNHPYKYYNLSASPSNAPLEMYLVETTFDLVLTWVTLSYCASALVKTPDDIWGTLRDNFMANAIECFSTMVFPKDTDESGIYDSTDETTNTKSTQLFA